MRQWLDWETIRVSFTALPALLPRFVDHPSSFWPMTKCPAGYFLGSCQLPVIVIPSSISFLFTLPEGGKRSKLGGLINQCFLRGWRPIGPIWPSCSNKTKCFTRLAGKMGQMVRCRQGKLVVMAKNGRRCMQIPKVNKPKTRGEQTNQRPETRRNYDIHFSTGMGKGMVWVWILERERVTQISSKHEVDCVRV